MSSNPATYASPGIEHTQPTDGNGFEEIKADAEELLELLGDEYTREVLAAVVDQPRSGRDVAESTSVSKPTAFRRLNSLEEAGLVTTQMVFDSDGHHHKEYRALVSDVNFEVGPDGFEVSVEGVDRSGGHPHGAVPADD